MLTALLLTVAAVPTAVDAERAFAADAQTMGVWTAFRKYADPDAVMFTPQAVWVQTYLKDRKDPPRAFDWWPTQSFTSCDGHTAVNVGDAVTADRQPMSHFTTVWQRQDGQWHWVYDGGVPVDGQALSPKGTRPRVIQAKCRGHAPGAPIIPPLPLTDRQAHQTPEDSGRGQSADKTLGWDWKVAKDGSRHFRVYQWNGKAYALVVNQNVPASSQ